MTTMRCPSCGESVELGETGVTFRHIFRASGQSSMFHDEQLVHECNIETLRTSAAPIAAGSAVFEFAPVYFLAPVHEDSI
jgi:hypothetical protein